MDMTIEAIAKGEVFEVKQEIDLSEVPQMISDALSAKAPLFKPDIVHRIIRNDRVAGYLFANTRRVAWLSHDAKEFEIHREQ
jgi:hypothetical protein